MNSFNEGSRGRLDSRIPNPLPGAPPHEIRHQLPSHSGNEDLSDEEVKEESTKQQGEQSDSPPFSGGGLSTLDHTGLVFPGSKGESQQRTDDDEREKGS